MNRRADNKLTDQPLRDLMAQVRGSQTQQLGNAGNAEGDILLVQKSRMSRLSIDSRRHRNNPYVEVAIGFDQGSLQFVGNLRLIPCDA